MIPHTVNRRLFISVLTFAGIVVLLGVQDSYNVNQFHMASSQPFEKTFRPPPIFQPIYQNISADTESIQQKLNGTEEETNDRKTILFWNSYWSWKFFGMGYGNKGFVKAGCKYTNCYTVTNRKKLVHDDVRVDAILVHDFDQDLAEVARNMDRDKEEILQKNQGKMPNFVYFNKEAMNSDVDGRFRQYPDYAQLFNIIYTFRLDSTVNFPYGRIVERKRKHLKDDPNQQIKWLQPPTKLPANIAKLDFSHKTKDILWMVSHCDTTSKREVYVTHLRQATNLTIDVLGKCGKDVLGSETAKSVEDTSTSREAMYAEQVKDYKFYLAFENNYCQDYHTEKFFSAMKSQNVIPVVMGGKHPSDFAKIAPPRSYLNIDDFSSVEELAKKLEMLASDPTAYKEYFWWTNHYRVTSIMEGYESAQCQLCEILNQQGSSQHRLPSIDLRDYWSSQKHCRYPGTKEFPFPWVKS